MSQINAYLFDIGNVILQFDFSIAVEKLKAKGINHDDPIGHIAKIKDLYEAGEMDDEKFVEQAVEELGFSGTEEEFIEIWQRIFTLNTPMANSLEQIAKSGAPLYLLSNTNGLHMLHILRDYPIFKVFSGGIYSHEAKSMKPNTPMYEQAIARYNLIPEETLYIDDLPANIETGKQLGFQTHQYELDNHQAFTDTLPN